MSMACSKFQHTFDSWVYPRVYHFQKRFLDVHERFTNVISHGPHSFVFKLRSELYNKIVDLKGSLEHPLEICVIGKNDIAKDDLIISSEEPDKTEQMETDASRPKGSKAKPTRQGLTVVLLHIDIKNADENGVKNVREIVSEFTSKHRRSIAVTDDSVIVVCEQSAISSQQKLNEFRQAIITDLKKHSLLDLTESQIIFPNNKRLVSANVSQVLESRIIFGFSLMKAHLQSFVRGVSNLSMENKDILETETFVGAVQGFIRSGMAFVDILEDSKTKGEPFEELLLSNLVRVIRCAVMDPISKKFDLTQEVCNQVAFEIELDESMKGLISKNTRYHLGKTEKHACDLAEAIRKGDKWYTFPGRDFLFIVYPLRDDIRSTVLEFEKALANMRKIVHVLKKMIFEINGNIKVSLFEVEDSSTSISYPCFPDDLRKNLSQIDGVYGMGCIFGNLEVHVESDEVKQSVKDMLTEYKIKQPIRIRKVLTKARQLAGNQVEHGISLHTREQNNSDRFKSGTLGMFADSANGDLYALTCGHVVNVADDSDRNVYVTDGSGENQLLGTSSSDRTVLSGEPPAIFVDFAAVKVQNDFVPRCTKYLKDDDGMLKNAILSTARPRALNSLYIFKYGASSHLTKGIVVAVDYTIGNAHDDFIILIAPLPDVHIVDYATAGDSGSVNCMRDVNNNRAVGAVSMLSGGGLTIKGHEETFSLSFKLSKGFEVLGNMPFGVRLQVPSENSGMLMF